MRYFLSHFLKISLFAYLQLSDGSNGLMVCQSLYLHPYFEFASSKDSGETVLMCRLIWALLGIYVISTQISCAAHLI